MTAPDANYLFELQTQIARTQGLQRKFDDAHKTLDDVKSSFDARPAVKMRAMIRYELERGRVFNSSNRKAEAIPHFERALEQGIEMKEDVLAVDAAHMLGIATMGDTALDWNERAVQMAESSDNPKAKGWLGALYNNIGWTYHDMGKYDVALDYFERDLKWYEERKLENQSRIAKWSIAKMHRLLGDPANAFEEQKAILEEIEDKKIDPDGYVFEELGECSLALGRDEAEWKGYFTKAYELLSKDQWSVANEPKKHARLKELLGID
jgi:tetratricopeptide (TPR) repeat protein